MGLEYYGFALFVAGLICLIAILCKVLFTDLKRQQKLLDEKESKILQLYNTVETIMEEFTDQVKATTEELKEYESRAITRMASITLPPEAVRKEQVLDKLPRTLPFNANRIRVAGEVLERAERIIKSDAVIPPEPLETNENGVVFQRFFDDTADRLPPVVEDISGGQTRNEAILTLAAEGKTYTQIASELGITQNEVQLVVDLAGK